MSPNVITVYDFVFGAQFCTEKICQQKQTRPKSLAYLKSFEPIFQGNFAHHEPIDVTPEMTFENRLEKFVDFDLPEQTTAETGVSLSVEAKQKILGLNACKLYDIDPVEHGARLKADEFGQKAATGPGPQAEGALAEGVGA